MSNPLGLAAIFLACADSGGFSAAGRKLAMSRSSVGKAIGRLEAQLGVRLFHRTTRAHALTEQGQIFYERARRALSELEAAQAMFDSGRREPSGILKVTAPVALGRRCVAPALLELLAEFPGLKLAVSFTDRPVDLIEEGFDLAVRVGAVSNGAGLMGRRIGGQRMTICAAPSYLERRGAPRTRADLAAHDVLLYNRNKWLAPEERAAGRDAAAATRVTFDDLDALADAATLGLGLARLPSWLIDEKIKAGVLTEVLPEESRASLDILALWPEGPYMPARTRAALDRLAARFADLRCDRA